MFSKAPPAVQQVLGLHLQPVDGSSKKVTEAAEKDYTNMLQQYENTEATVQKSTLNDDAVIPSIFDDSSADPDAPTPKQPKQVQKPKKPIVDPKTEVKNTERLVQEIEQQNGLDKLFNPTDVMRQMEKDIKHPPAYEKEEEQVLMSAHGASKGADQAKLKSLEDKVNVLEGLNARLALGSKAAPTAKVVTQKDAAARAQKVAQAGLKAVAQKADKVVEKAAAASTDAATQHALMVAMKAGQEAVKHAEKVTQGMLANKGAFQMPKLPGVTKDAWAGVKHALTAGKPDAQEIPGVKESTWPFAPGSFRARDVKIPGVNQDSWWVFEPGQSWRKDRNSVKKGFHAPGEGGCVQDSTGKLRCNGGKDGVVLANALDKAIGFGDQRKKLIKQPGEMQTIIPEIRNDAEAQKLNAAAAAFAQEMPLQRDMAGGNSAARKQILWQQRTPSVRGRGAGKFQDLEIVGSQCSNFFDCFRAKTSQLIAHHTQPIIGRDMDVDVSDPSQSVLDNLFNHDVSVSPRFKHEGDIQVPMGGPNTDYIGYISRPSARDPSHVAHDVMAAKLPNNPTMYHAFNHGMDGNNVLQKQALAQVALWESMLADENATGAGNGTATNSTGDKRTWSKTVCQQGVNCDSGQLEFPGDKPSSGGVCKHGVNCDSGYTPFSDDEDMFGDKKWKAGKGHKVPVVRGLVCLFLCLFLLLFVLCVAPMFARMHVFKAVFALVNMHAYQHACVSTCMHINMHAYQHACVSTCMHINMHAYQHACVSTCVRMITGNRVCPGSMMCACSKRLVM